MAVHKTKISESKWPKTYTKCLTRPRRQGLRNVTTSTFWTYWYALSPTSSINKRRISTNGCLTLTRWKLVSLLWGLSRNAKRYRLQYWPMSKILSEELTSSISFTWRKFQLIEIIINNFLRELTTFNCWRNLSV